MRPRFARACASAFNLVLAASALLAPPGRAAAQQAVPVRQTAVTLAVGEGRLFRLTRDASNVFVADSTVADVQVASARLVYVYGRRIGQTTLTAVGGNDAAVGSLQIRVERNPGAAQAAAAARGAPVTLGFAGDRLVVQGPVRDVGEAMEVEATAQAYSPNHLPPIDRSRLAGTQQVTLRVRIAEVRRNDLNELGVNLAVLARPGTFAVGLLTNAFASGALGGALSGVRGNALRNAAGAANGAFAGGIGALGTTSRRLDADALINALQREGVVTLLAEPNLTALSGETASFLAGGEVPIPVPQALGVTTYIYKPFGVSLAFTPTLLPGDRVAMRVRPEVSEPVGSIITQTGIAVPSFVTRRAETSVEMASGQTLAIAGLFQRNLTDQMDRVPLLGDVPILGALFRSQSFQRGETELMILITPYLSAPVAQSDAIPLPTDTAASRPRPLPAAGSRAGFVVN